MVQAERATAREKAARQPERLIAHLIAAGRITPGGVERAAQAAGESGDRIETVLTRLGLVSERDLTGAIAAAFDLRIASATDYPAVPVLEDRLSPKFLRDMRTIPLRLAADRLRVAMVNPLDDYAISAFRFAAEMPIEVCVAYPSEFETAFERLYGDARDDGIARQNASSPESSVADDVDRLSDQASEAPVVRLVNAIIARAAEMRASDIHIEPMENELVVRYRVDGVLQRADSPAKGLAAPIVSRIKVMAKLNIAERRLAQDGRITLAVRGTDIDFRVATTPTVHGESVVLRLLDRGQLSLDFGALGFEDHLVAGLRRLTQRPHGIVLVTGPTGSGKTTTLYTALSELNSVDRKILTIEDPIEYRLDGINQVQVKPQIGLSFANALRSFLRHDPDIMMIGEIRDLETARIAAQAALTGHLILSTLHTNDAPSAIARLIDMGLEDYLLTATLNGVVAQRLVRTLCPACREAYVPGAELIERLELVAAANGRGVELYRATGCGTCRGTGYRGRTPIVEILAISDALRDAIMRKAGAGELRSLASSSGMVPMQRHGFAKALVGLTSIDEVLRVTLEAP
ncbi:MAG: ATPase, T2SS/T4P/T4SS family [Rhizomicrobium sp.]